MTDAWSEYSDIHINTVPVPAQTGLADGTVVYSWGVETMEEIGQEGLILLQNLDFPAAMGPVSIDVLDARHLRLSQVGRRDSELLSSGPIAARMIDEQVVGLWLIDDVPHVRYPVFMDQIRNRIRGLTVIDRKRWAWLGLLRVEPMVEEVAGYEAGDEDLIPAVFDPSREAEIEAVLNRMQAALANHSARNDALTSTLRQAVKATLAGALSDSVNKLAYSREQVFDALYSSDKRLGGHHVTLAKAEDRARTQDVFDLHAATSGSHEEITARSRRDRAELLAALGRGAG